MNKLLGTLILICAFAPAVYAQNTTDQPQPTPPASSQQPQTVGDGVRQAGHEIKKGAHKVRKAIVTTCADGRHTIKGHAGCNGHGGVSPAN